MTESSDTFHVKEFLAVLTEIYKQCLVLWNTKSKEKCNKIFKNNGYNGLIIPCKNVYALANHELLQKLLSMSLNLTFNTRGARKEGSGKYWNYDASCTLTSLPVWDLQNFKHLIFVAQSIQHSSTFCGTLLTEVTKFSRKICH
jgi:hypothetical protein